MESSGWILLDAGIPGIAAPLIHAACTLPEESTAMEGPSMGQFGSFQPVCSSGAGVLKERPASAVRTRNMSRRCAWPLVW